MNPILRNLLIGAGVVLAIGFFARRQVSAAAEAVANVNVGTPFEGAGIIGTAGNIANQASGGLLADAGSAIGLFFSDIFDRRTLEDFDTELLGPPSSEFVGPPAPDG